MTRLTVVTFGNCKSCDIVMRGKAEVENWRPAGHIRPAMPQFVARIMLLL